MNVRFCLLYGIKINSKSHFWRKHVLILSIYTQRCYGRHNVSQKSVNHSFSCLSILLYCVISLPDATSYDKLKYFILFLKDAEGIVFKYNYAYM